MRTTTSRRRVLLIGHRSQGAFAAARLGLEAFMLAAREPGRKVRPHLSAWGVVDLQAPTEELAAAAVRLLGGAPADAVVALTEAAVVPAAQLRQQLGLEGMRPETAIRCHDKLHMKRAFGAAGVPCARYRLIEEGDTPDLLAQELGWPIVVKERACSGSRGTVVARDRRALKRCLRPGLLAEAFVDGVEMSLECFVVGGEVIFTNPTEYVVPLWANLVPAPLAPAERAALEDFCRRALGALEPGRGLLHIELYRCPQGIVLGEIAARPPGGYLMDLLQLAYGFDPWEAFLRVELGEKPTLPRGPRQQAGVWLLHPGSGEVRKVAGVEAARQVRGVREVRCKLAPGDHVPRRVGSGQDAGRIVAVGEDRDAVIGALERARRLIAIEVEEPARHAESGRQLDAPQ